MKKINTLILGAALLAFVGCNHGAKHEETQTRTKDSVATVAEETTSEEAAMDSAAMAKVWESYSTPGEMHKWMASTDGKWSAEMNFWAAPDQPAGPSEKSVVESKMILGGRYQQSIYKGKMMGMDFEGYNTLAYDNAKKKFMSTWIDNTGTGLMYMEGPYDEATKTVKLEGTSVDPSTGKGYEMREEMKIIDDKTQLMTMYTKKNGKEFKSMEIRMTKN